MRTKKPTTKKPTINILNRDKKVYIKQYVDDSEFNMGLEKYGMSVFEGENGSGGGKEYISYQQTGDTKVYLTGLDTDATSIEQIENEDVREQKIKEIEEVKTYLEKKKKTELNSENESFWKGMYLDINKPSIKLNLNDDKDLLTYYIIKGGGYNSVAPSYTEARDSYKTYKFYLHEDDLASKEKVNVTRTKNLAIVELEKMYQEDQSRMFYTSKLILPIFKNYKKSSGSGDLYSNLADFINGVGYDTDIRQKPQEFLDVAKSPLESLKVRAVVAEAIYQGVLRKDSETNGFYNKHTGTKYPNSPEAMAEFLMSPMNSNELGEIAALIENIWNK
jgi:hypothetical protein